MDQSYSDSDVTLSPSQILERLQALRQLQLLQHGKLQKQRLEYHESPEITSSITEIVSHFSNSTSYNTFRSLLQSSEASNDLHSNSPICVNISRKYDNQNIMEGVSVLNVSETSEFEPDTPISSMSSAKLSHEKDKLKHFEQNSIKEKQISLDDMPILSPKKDFESLITEKLENDKSHTTNMISKMSKSNKKPFLKRGEGMARFGLQKNKLVLQNINSLPWRKRKANQSTKSNSKETKSKDIRNKHKTNNGQEKTLVDKTKNISPLKVSFLPSLNNSNMEKRNDLTNEVESKPNVSQKSIDTSVEKSAFKNNSNTLLKGFVKGNPPLVSDKEKTWASVLTKEQDEFLRQLKQSNYYKNFVSPVKSMVSDISCDENHSKLVQERETAEQNMFEVLENKVSHESFNINNSFLNRFLRQNNLEYSGESTPVVMQKCLSKNPNLMHLLPNVRTNESTFTDGEGCDSECSHCNDHSFVSDCCSCKTVSNISIQTSKRKEGSTKKKVNLEKQKEEKQSHNDISKSTDNEDLNKNMVEMNAKLVATSELLKDRLRELEDEIETFRTENTNLTKMKEDIELERQKFYDEKNSFEQKFNEEKILSEYYLAEEKEKLSKQKQMYDRYVRDMRGRLNKKEKDEVINLKKEIIDLREQIRAKDAKSTSTIARLRNHLKIIEREKKNLSDEVDKLKKENRRIQHSNDITRRVTNLKYLEQINKKLTNMATKDAQSDIVYDSDIKYKAYEIERQSRGRKITPTQRGAIRPRAKSVPNLKVTSRYAKYFSQKDSLSEKEKNESFSHNLVKAYPYSSNNALLDSDDENISDNSGNKTSDSEEDNNLEKMYNDRFKSLSPTTRKPTNKIHSSSRSPELLDHPENNNDVFLKKNASHILSHSSISPNQSNQNNPNHRSSLLNSQNSNGRKSPATNYYENCDISTNYQRTKSPVTILSSCSSSQNSGTVVKKAPNCDSRMMPSPEPTVSKTSLSKTNLNPTEIRKPDGSKEIRFPNGNVKIISTDGKYSKFVYYNGDIKENFYNEGRIKYYYAQTKTYHTTHPDGLEILEFPDGQVEKRYKDGSTEIRLPNGSIRYFDPKNEHVREEWRFPDGVALTVSANGDQRIVFANGQVEVHAKDHKRREFPDGTVKLVYNDGTAETRYASGRVRIKDKHGNLLMDSATG